MIRFVTALGGALLLSGCSGVVSSAAPTVNADPSNMSGSITIAAAASLTDVLPVLITDFQARHPGAVIATSFAGSSTLVEQVLAGASVDVLATASVATINNAVEAGVVESPQIFASNSMAVVVPAGNPGEVRTLQDLQRADLLVGLCEVTVPCGAAAQQVLDKATLRLTPVTQELDVRALLGKVIAGELDAGVVYATDALSAVPQVEIIAIPEEFNAATQYPAAVVRESPNQVLAAAFVDYLARDSAAQTILRDFGFGVPSDNGKGAS